MAFGKNIAMSSSFGRGTRLGSVSCDMFFDRQELVGQMNKAERRALIKGGALVRTVARRSMRPRKPGVASSPGAPPHRHKHSSKGEKAKHDYGLYNSILFGFDAPSESVVIGPSATWGPRALRIMETHEFGGFERKKNPRRRIRKVGGGGELRIGKRVKLRDKLGRFRGYRESGPTTRRVTDSLKGDVEVTYGKLFTPEQARRANELNEALYGPMVLNSTYPARPTMGPALTEVAPKLPGMIEDEWSR